MYHWKKKINPSHYYIKTVQKFGMQYNLFTCEKDTNTEKKNIEEHEQGIKLPLCFNVCHR